MFGLQKYVDNLFLVKWYFKEDYQEPIESILLARFKKVNNHYKLEEVQYTYMDLLLGMEQMDFTLKKTGDDITINITKI